MCASCRAAGVLLLPRAAGRATLCPVAVVGLVVGLMGCKSFGSCIAEVLWASQPTLLQHPAMQGIFDKEGHRMGAPKTKMHHKRSKQIHNPGRWFIVSRDLIVGLGFDGGIFMGYLINLAIQQEVEWFRCSSEKLQINLQVTRPVERRIIKRLIAQKIIKRKLMGVPAKRYFSIDYDKIEEYIDQGFAKLANVDGNGDDDVL